MPLTQPDGAIRTLAAGAYIDAIFSHDGTRLFTVAGNTISVISVADGSTVRSYTVGAQLGAIDISMDGRYLAIVEEQSGAMGTLYRIDLTNGSASTFNFTATSPLHDVAFLANGSVVISQESSAPLRVVNLGTGDFWEASGPIDPNATITISADGSYFIAQPPSGDLHAFDTEVGTGYSIFWDPYAGASIQPGSAVGAVSPDGGMVVQGATMRVYEDDFSSNISLIGLHPDIKNPAALAFSPDGTKLYVLASNVDKVIVVSTSSWTILASYPVGADAVHPAAWPTGTPTPGEMMRVSDDGDFLSIITPTGVQAINLNLVIEPSYEADDVLTGGTGSDILAGGAGEDTISGGDGDDALFSHTDDFDPYNTDTLSLDIYAEHDVISGDGGSDDIYAGYGDDVDGGADGYDGDSLFISFLGAPSGITVDFSLATQTIGGGTITGIENLRWIQGSDFADTINAADRAPHYSGVNTVLGMGGNDHLIAGSYTNALDGGDGDDLLDGRPGGILSSARGGAGNDTIYTGSSNSVGYGDAGDDVIHAYYGAYGGSGNDTIIGYGYPYGGLGLHGEDDNDRITGSSENEFITGGSGADVLEGGAGNDALGAGSALPDAWWQPADDMGQEKDTLSAGDGNDKVWAGYGDDVDGGTGTDSLFLSFGGLTAGIDFDTGALASAGPLTIGGGTIRNFEEIATLRTTEFADNVTVAADCILLRIDLGAGNDVVTTLRGNTDIFGGDGDDRLILGPGSGIFNNHYAGGSGSDTIDYRNATTGLSLQLQEEGNGIWVDVLGNVFLDIENVLGSAYADLLQGNGARNHLAGDAGNDSLEGGAGDDTLDGGGGGDVMRGGVGNDRYRVDSSTDQVLETTGEGIDTVYATWTYGLSSTTEVEALWVLDPTSTLDIKLVGNAYAQTIAGNAGNNLLVGAGGNDTLEGFGGNDTLDGGSGGDILRGGLGNDSYCVDSSADQVIETTGQGVDTVYATWTYGLSTTTAVEALRVLDPTSTLDIKLVGNAYAQTITGNAGNNLLVGAGGNDTLGGFGGNDTLDGGSGGDVMRGGLGNDSYRVDSSTDQVLETTGEGTDSVYATWNYALTQGSEVELLQVLDVSTTSAIKLAGNDFAQRIVGNAGANTLSGLGGNDTVEGGSGNDSLNGGSGDDILTGGTGSDTFVFTGSDGTDTITDFVHGTDRINLSVIDAKSDTTTDDAFTWIGSNGFTGVAGQVRAYTSDSVTYLEGDVNGDGVADFLINLGSAQISASDLIL